jgi:putative peptidoglycan lipid II flippase
MAPGFFARHDTTTPVKVALAAMLVNVSLTLLLGLGLGLAHVGVALALTTAGWVNALLLMALLRRRGHFALDARSQRSLPRILAAALGMGVLLLLLERLLAPGLGGPLALRCLALALLVTGGLAGFAALTFVFGAADWREVKRRLRRQTA